MGFQVEPKGITGHGDVLLGDGDGRIVAGQEPGVVSFQQGHIRRRPGGRRLRYRTAGGDGMAFQAALEGPVVAVGGVLFEQGLNHDYHPASRFMAA